VFKSLLPLILRGPEVSIVIKTGEMQRSIEGRADDSDQTVSELASWESGNRK
jgi:hypothetical protein